MENLKKCSILVSIDTRISFKYPYIFYFFVGKRIADYLIESADEESKNIFFNVLEKLYKEDHANILIFITHHTKSPWVLKKINDFLKNLFNKNAPAQLTRPELGFMMDFVSKIPALVMEQRNIQTERENYNR
ncbi:STAND family AAA ATPase [Neisseria perflava]|uniref:STAND family AAA ATPase n=1 Tax=Neisseria perflava TaxID=33053 RepID=UPI003F5913ED